MSNASGNGSDGRGSASAGEGASEKVVQKGTKASEGKGLEKGKAIDEGPKNKTTGTWHALTNI
jgi:hypothetical protein